MKPRRDRGAVLVRPTTSEGRSLSIAIVVSVTVLGLLDIATT
jgi:hypothetical protein